MLTHTFMHIQGIGRKTEQRLWEAGLLNWDRLESAAGVVPSRCRGLLRVGVADSLRHIAEPAYFTRRMPAALGWRIFPDFRGSTAYLDIETTGLDRDRDRITTIALYDGCAVKTYVQGRNLDEFPRDVLAFKVLVSYNGKCFDQPFLERTFNIRLSQAAIDLRYILKCMGLTGGLKRCEASLGMGRGDLSGVDGFLAVLLWERYRRCNDDRALETLLAYNVQDTINLEPILVTAYNRNLAETPFAERRRLPDAPPPANPFKAHPDLVAELTHAAAADAGRFYGYGAAAAF